MECNNDILIKQWEVEEKGYLEDTGHRFYIVSQKRSN